MSALLVESPAFSELRLSKVVVEAATVDVPPTSPRSERCRAGHVATAV